MKLQKIQSKKAQLETMQTVFIVLFLFISLFFVLVVVVAKDKANARTQIEQLVLLTEYKKAQIMDYLPELRCSFENVILKDCYDKLAIDSFANTVSKNQLYYNQLFGHAKLQLMNMKLIGKQLKFTIMFLRTLLLLKPFLIL